MIMSHQRKPSVFRTEFTSWEKSVPPLLEGAGLIEGLNEHQTILIKPNLVEALEPPVTTPVELIAVLIDYLQQKAPNKKLLIGEGTGAPDYDTFHCFDTLGYTQLSAQTGVELLDLNNQECVKKHNPTCSRWPEMHLPKLLDEVFLLSVPVLKVHTLADVTLTMKNMMGCPPPKHYQQGGYWKKSSFHRGIQKAVFDLNQYRSPNFTLLDATVGMAESHLWGVTCEPPVNTLAAGWDPVAIDSYGCSLLGKDWREIGHIRMANGILGKAEPLYISSI